MPPRSDTCNLRSPWRPRSPPKLSLKLIARLSGAADEVTAVAAAVIPLLALTVTVAAVAPATTVVAEATTLRGEVAVDMATAAGTEDAAMAVAAEEAVVVVTAAAGPGRQRSAMDQSYATAPREPLIATIRTVSRVSASKISPPRHALSRTRSTSSPATFAKILITCAMRHQLSSAISATRLTRTRSPTPASAAVPAKAVARKAWRADALFHVSDLPASYCRNGKLTNENRWYGIIIKVSQ